jgi:hypothetical protein
MGKQREGQWKSSSKWANMRAQAHGPGELGGSVDIFRDRGRTWRQPGQRHVQIHEGTGRSVRPGRYSPSAYLEEKVDRIVVIYNEFKSLLQQRIVHEQLLPVPPEQEGPVEPALPEEPEAQLLAPCLRDPETPPLPHPVTPSFNPPVPQS